MKNFLLAVMLLIGSGVAAQKFEGLALTPPMGWNSWNTFQTNISEELVKQTADIMVSSGMKAAGYNYLVLDDGWMAMERDSVSGDLVPDPKKFPNGIEPVVAYVHSKGLKFGLYNCAGTKTCAGYPGTRGYEYQDARNYAKWQIDYLKFDWCNSDGLNAKEAYTTMSKAIRKAGRPMVFSLCEWGSNKPWEWAANVGQLWRTTGDIGAKFDGIIEMGNWHANGVMTNVDLQDSLYGYAGPGHWNDPDMLEVGNGLSDAENRAHFSVWAMMAAPLIAGNDIRKMTPETSTVLNNPGVIAIDQDSLGRQGIKYSDRDSLQTWLKPLKNGEWAVCFLNRGRNPKQISFDWKNTIITYPDAKIEMNVAKNNYKLTNVWSNQEIGDTEKTLSATVDSHDVLLLRLVKEGANNKEHKSKKRP